MGELLLHGMHQEIWNLVSRSPALLSTKDVNSSGDWATWLSSCPIKDTCVVFYLLHSKQTSKALQRIVPWSRDQPVLYVPKGTVSAHSDTVCWKKRRCFPPLFETKLQIPWFVQCIGLIQFTCSQEPLQLMGTVFWLGPSSVVGPF